LAFIVFAQRLGMTLREVGEELARLPNDHVPTGEDWSRLSERWAERIDAQVAQLLRLRDSLSECIGCGCLSLQACKVFNPNDAAAQAGPGPRNWTSAASG
jgi:MerR family redox-sensitive transcriptional activator SoxR